MCVTFFLWLHPGLPDLLLLVLFNRDELMGRPTVASHFWEDDPHVLGGRDCVAGGTWMCVSTTGRAAFLTNVRELRAVSRLGAPSRGALPVDFVTSQAGPKEFLCSLDTHAFPGFNLMAADLRARRMAYLCNKTPEVGPAEVSPGLHGITNGFMDAHWPKVDEGLRRLQELIDGGAFAACSRGGGGEASRQDGSSSGSGQGSAVPWDALFSLLSDDRRLEEDPARLPKTGYGDAFEAAVSSIFVQPVDTPLGPFGTRSQIVLAVRRDGQGELRERYHSEGDSWEEVRHTFEVPGLLDGAAQQSAAVGGTV